MDSAKRLEQAVEKLEYMMSQKAEISAIPGNETEKVNTLLEENKELKNKQEQIKFRLDTLIENVKAGA